MKALRPQAVLRERKGKRQPALQASATLLGLAAQSDLHRSTETSSKSSMPNKRTQASTYADGLRAALSGAAPPPTGTVAGITTPFAKPPVASGAGTSAALAQKSTQSLDLSVLGGLLASLSNCVAVSGFRIGTSLAAREAQELANCLAMPFVQDLPPAHDFYNREEGICVQDGKIVHRLAPSRGLCCAVYSVDWAALTRDVVANVLGGFPWSPAEQSPGMHASIKAFVQQLRTSPEGSSRLLPWNEWQLWHWAEVPFKQLVEPVQCTPAQRDSWGEVEMENIQQDGADMLQSAFDEALRELFQRCVHQLRVDVKSAVTDILRVAARSLSHTNGHTLDVYRAVDGQGPHAQFAAVARVLPPSMAWGHLVQAAGAAASKPGGAFSTTNADAVFDVSAASAEVRAELSSVATGLDAWPKLRRAALGVAGVLTGLTSRGAAVRTSFRENLKGSIFTCMHAFYDYADIVFSMEAGHRGAEGQASNTAVSGPAGAPHAAAEQAQAKEKEAAEHSAAAAAAPSPGLGTEGVFSDVHLRALEGVPGKPAISSDTAVTASALPVHAYALPQPSSVKAALGLKTAVKAGNMGMTPMPPPMTGASLFTHRGSVYLLSGAAQHLPSDAVRVSIHSVPVREIHLAGLQVVTDALQFMHITQISHLLDANLKPIDLKDLIAPHLGRLAAAPVKVRKCLRSVWAVLHGEEPPYPNAKTDGFIRRVQQLQVSVDISSTSRVRFYPKSALYRLELSGSNYKYQSLLVDERVPQDKQAALQRLARIARGHGQAAEWVRVPPINYGNVSWPHTLAVPLNDKSDPRVVVIGGFAEGKWRVNTTTITPQGAGMDKPSKLARTVPAAPGASAVKLIGEPTVVLYGGHSSNTQTSGLHFISVSKYGVEIWMPGLAEVCGDVPKPPLAHHGACMLRNGNMVVAGGAFGRGKPNPDVYVASILGCRAVTGSPLACGPSTDSRVLWSKVALAPGSASMGQPRRGISMHKLPGGDSFVVFGGQVRSDDSTTQPKLCTIRSYPGGVQRAALEHVLSPSATNLAKWKHDIESSEPFVAFEAKWAPLHVEDSMQSRPGQEPVVWDSPRHGAASTMLNGRLLLFGGLFQARSSSAGVHAVTSFPFEKDFSTVLKSQQYSSTAARTRGGAGIHAWGVPAVVDTCKGGMRSDVQVVKLVADSIRLAASSMPTDMHWLWAGAHWAHVSCIAEQWSIQAGNVSNKAPSDSTVYELQEATGADDARLSSASVADVVLQCAAPLGGDWPRERTALAAHRCVVGSTIPLLHMQLQALEATVDGSEWDLHGAAEDEDAGPPAPAPTGLLAFQFGDAAESSAGAGLDLSSAPRLTLQRSVSVGASSARPALAQPQCSAREPLVLSLPFVPVDVMSCIVKYVYTGSVDVSGALLPAVWAACQVLGLAGTAKAVMKASRAHCAAEKTERGVTSKTVFEPRSKKWRHNVLFNHGRSALSDPSWSSDPTDFAECALPLVAVDSKLSAACEEHLQIDVRADGSKALKCTQSEVSLGSHARGVNRSTVAALRWLHGENAFGDMLLEIQLPEVEGDEVEASPLVQAAPRSAFLRAHAAILAARSKLWRGSLCSEHFRRDGHVASLGAQEGIQLSIEDASSILDFVYTDSCKSIAVDTTPLALPLASQHSMARLSSFCERTMVHSFDLDDVSSALGMWFYGRSLGTAGARLARIALAAVRDAAVSPAVLQEVVKQFVQDGEVDEETAQAFLGDL